MARQTRAQRRARRAQMTPGGEAALPAPPAPSRKSAAPARGEARPQPAREPRAIPGSGSRRFVFESWAELKKVEWPTQKQLIQGVVVVLIACFIVGIYLWGADLVFKRLVHDVFL
jgi:preprotein translocase subunit SecE